MKDRKLRLIINSNAIYAKSGYGQQLADFVPKIRDAGFPVATIAFYGLEGGIISLDGITIYPKLGSAWGEDAMVHHSKHFKADATMTLQDLWTLNPEVLRSIPRFIPIVPIDHDPIPPAIHLRLKNAYRIIAMSQFGRDEMKRVGLHSTYIPHTIDTEIFKPMDKAKAKSQFGLSPDTFIFGMVSANKDNPPRKSFQEVLDAFKIFNNKYPNSAIYFHTQFEQAGGFPIGDYARFLGIPNDKVFHSPYYEMLTTIDKKDMAGIYNAFDVLLCPSTNEGFGVPIIEAESCGVPVIVNRFTAMPEHVLEHETGEICEVASKRFTPLGSYIGIPDTMSLYRCMEKLYKADRVKMGEKARDYMLRKYDLNKVFENRWMPFLDKVENEVYPTPHITVPSNIDTAAKQE